VEDVPRSGQSEFGLVTDVLDLHEAVERYVAGAGENENARLAVTALKMRFLGIGQWWGARSRWARSDNCAPIHRAARTSV
jgi:hypothetical protein